MPNNPNPNFAQSNNYQSNPNNQNIGQPQFAQPINPNFGNTNNPTFKPLQPTLSQTIPGIQIDKEPFNWQKYLLLFVISVYTIFSLIWLGVLYFAPDGSKVCNNGSCYITLPLTRQVDFLKNEYRTQSDQLKSQSTAKNSLNEIIQNELTFNDKVNESIVKVFKSQENYELYIQRNIRFINNKPEFSESFSQQELESRLVDLKKNKQELNTLIEQNYSNKEIIKNKIQEIYNKLGESPINQYIQ